MLHDFRPARASSTRVLRGRLDLGVGGYGGRSNGTKPGPVKDAKIHCPVAYQILIIQVPLL